MHRAGWKRHPIRETLFPSHEFGSAAGKSDWQAWIRNYLNALHAAGVLRANPKTNFSKEGNAKDRSKIREKYFEDIYSAASQPSFAGIIQNLNTRLDHQAWLQSQDLGGLTFLSVIAVAHPECAPEGFIA